MNVAAVAQRQGISPRYRQRVLEGVGKLVHCAVAQRQGISPRYRQRLLDESRRSFTPRA